MICSASDLSSSGLSGAVSSPTSSPFTRIVAGRPTFSRRSDPLRWTIWVMADLKLKAGEPAWGASGIGIDPAKDLSEFHGLGVLHEDLPDHALHLGLDFVHDLHRLDDADHLTHGDPAADLHVRLRPRLRRLVERPDHGRLDLEELGRGRRDLPFPGSRLRPRPRGEQGCGRWRGSRHDQMRAYRIGGMARLP